MHQGIAHFECSALNIARTVHPVIIGGSGRRRTYVHMDIGAMGVINQTVIDDIRALMETDFRLRVNSEMETVELVNALPHQLHHRGQEPT